MQEFHWQGEREFYGSGRARPDLWGLLQSFSAQNLRAARYDKKMVLVPSCQIHVRSRSVEGFTLARTTTTDGRSRVVRYAAEIASDGRDQFALLLSLCGEANVSQFGRRVRVAPESYALTASSQPIVQESGTGRGDSIYFAIPREFVDQRVVIGEDICVRSYDAGRGLHKLVFETVNLFQQNAWNFTDDDFQKSARVVADLVLLALGSSADLSSGECSIRAANLARAKHIIRKRLSDPELTLSDIARESRLSLRYLHKLFRDEGRTMYEYLKNERLQRARELLELSSSRKMNVTDVALECGFSDMSYFSRLFKQAFSISPRDVFRRH